MKLGVMLLLQRRIQAPAVMVTNLTESSGIQGETKLFLGENGSYLERNPHFFCGFFPHSFPIFPTLCF